MATPDKNPPPRANPRNFTLGSHGCGLSRWLYQSPHPLSALLTPDYWQPVRDHRPKRGDIIEAIYAVDGEPLERAEMIVTTGVEKLGPGGVRAPITVEPAGPAYREKAPATKPRKEAA